MGLQQPSSMPYFWRRSRPTAVRDCVRDCASSRPRGLLSTRPSPLRRLAMTARIVLVGGSEPDLACEVIAGLWQVALLPRPHEAHGYEISIAAVGQRVYVSSDADHLLGPGQRWVYDEDDDDAAERMPDGLAHTACFDVHSSAGSEE